MTLLDRYILVRFLVSFITLFALLFLFGVSIDVIINLDEFVGVARDKAGEDTSWIALTWYTATTIVDFQLPRAFQFYAFLYGLIAIGAFGRNRISEYFIGSNAASIVRTSPVAVLLAR